MTRTEDYFSLLQNVALSLIEGERKGRLLPHDEIQRARLSS